MDNRLSLIIPMYNAESFIFNTLIRLTEWRSKISYSAQIILVNDGSTDSSLAIVEDYIKTKDAAIELLSYTSNQGKGYAVKTGMLSATGDYRIFTDSDIPFGFKIIDQIIHYLDFKEFDVCIGDRNAANSKYFMKIGKLRKLASQFFTIIISRFVVTGVADTQCGLKGFKADIAEKLFSKIQIKGFAFDVEVLYLCYKYEFEIKKILLNWKETMFPLLV